ncbi:transposable element Tcb2 transposase [Trichonephila clavipes]|nr:transposable element Tcb2 transposase [Trichonephila clavipes]
MSGPKRHKRRECTQNACGRCAQLKTTVKGRTKVGSSCPRKTTAVDDQYIVLQAKRAPNQSASVIVHQLCTVTGWQVSPFTVARCLHKGDRLTRHPERFLPLKVGYRRHYLEWCKKHKNWTCHQYSRVLLTDESHFSATTDSKHQLIWREVGTQFHPRTSWKETVTVDLGSSSR